MKATFALSPEITASVLAASTAFIGGTVLHLPVWAIFIGWAGAYLAGGQAPGVLRSMWVAMPVGSTFALSVVVINERIGSVLGESQVAHNAVLAVIILAVNTLLMYAGRTRLLHLVPAMFLGFASYFATYFGGFGWEAGNPWTAWLAVVSMNALGPVFVIIAARVSGERVLAPQGSS